MASAVRFAAVLCLLPMLGCQESLNFGEACPHPSDTLHLTATAADPLPSGTCDERPAILSLLNAELRIENRPTVPMIVNRETGNVKGGVIDLPTNEIHPALLIYSVEVAGAQQRELAYRWGVIDLTGLRCEEPVSFASEDQLLLTPQQVDHLLAGSTAGDADRVADGEGLRFAQEILSQADHSLDQDGGGGTNLEEACAGTLE